MGREVYEFVKQVDYNQYYESMAGATLDGQTQQRYFDFSLNSARAAQVQWGAGGGQTRAAVPLEGALPQLVSGRLRALTGWVPLLPTPCGAGQAAGVCGAHAGGAARRGDAKRQPVM